jgi:hypothetical protein
MIPTKTYPLSAIMGEEMNTQERIAELEAQLKHAEGHAAELEAEVKMLRVDAERYQWLRERHENTIMDIYNSISPAMIKPELLDAAIDAERKGK